MPSIRLGVLCTSAPHHSPCLLPTQLLQLSLLPIQLPPQLVHLTLLTPKRLPLIVAPALRLTPPYMLLLRLLLLIVVLGLVLLWLCVWPVLAMAAPHIHPSPR